ncbi:MAG: hypothetical protein QF437_18595 [Planctomycetota bacterium]|nr:hypothetical protein [Planctomycetota bacterium]MDP7132511.1 hypothetical protein [Planctomycetota bacterium]MDP7249804.1 hypothetical protein [Planctomycetota bacterium]
MKRRIAARLIELSVNLNTGHPAARRQAAVAVVFYRELGNTRKELAALELACATISQAEQQ